MTKTFTHDDLIRYIYRETSDEEERELKNALLCDSRLAELFKEVNLTIKSLDGIFEEDPSERSLENIFHYSKTMHCHTVN
jgi:hypothetical protein